MSRETASFDSAMANSARLPTAPLSLSLALSLSLSFFLSLEEM